jgi:basic amino acid/polyamine antiporter, APA family
MAGITEEPTAEHNDLQRVLGPWHLIALGIGGVIGAGIFVITGYAAADFAGPGVVISFAIAGVGCFFAALCYAEYASIIPVAGSAYTYTYATLGKFMAWFIGWNLVLEYLATSATVTVGWSGYFTDLLSYLGVALPHSISSAPLCVATNVHCSTYSPTASPINAALSIGFTGSYVNLPAVLLVALVTVVLVLGVKLSAMFNNVMVSLKLLIVVLVIIVGLPYAIGSVHHTPFIPPNAGEWGHFGWSGVFRATGVIFFAYIGFDAVSVAAQETKNPQRNVPIGLLGALAVCTILYMLMSYVLTGLAPYSSLNVSHPVSWALANIPQTAWLAPYVNIGAVIGLATVVLVLLLGQSRICYAMARDGMIPPLFSVIHPKFHTPWKGTIVISIFCALLGGLLPIDVLGELVSIGTLLAFVIVCAGVMILRRTRPDLKRPFRTPLLWLVAPGGILTCGAMMKWLPLDTWLRLALWTAIGLVIYYFYGRHHAKASRWLLDKDEAE